MTYYDAAMIGVMVAGMVWGALRGITWQIASIASLVLGYSVAHPVSAQLAPSFPGDPVVARALAMLATYVAVSGGVFLAAWIVRATLRRMQFEAYDRHLGMILGGMEGALLGLVATIFVVSLAPSTRPAIFESPSGKVARQVLGAIGPVLPSEVRTELAPFLPGGEEGAAVPTLSARRPVYDAAVAPASSPGASDAASITSKLESLLEKGEAQVGKAIADAAKKEFVPTGGRDDRTTERR